MPGSEVNFQCMDLRKASLIWIFWENINFNNKLTINRPLYFDRDYAKWFLCIIQLYLCSSLPDICYYTYILYAETGTQEGAIFYNKILYLSSLGPWNDSWVKTCFCLPPIGLNILWIISMVYFVMFFNYTYSNTSRLTLKYLHI